jgi:hypothetical protein
LPRGALCDSGPRHRVVDLETVAGREAHLREVWGPPSRQQQLRAIVRDGAAGSGLGAVLQFADCGIIDGETLLALIAGIVVVGLLFVAVGFVVRKLTARRHLRPYGATARRRLPETKRAMLGVAEGTPHPSPLHGDSCLAFSILLRSTRSTPIRSEVLWREASTAGFTIRLDDGALVRIPSGRIELVESSRGARRAPRDKAAARLPAGLGIDVEGELSDLPFDLAGEEIIRPSQRVAILSRVELREDPDRLPASPRAPANLAWVAVGIPVLAPQLPTQI